MDNNQARYGTDYHAHLLEQYKLYVEMADRVSQRRMDTNKFFISVHTFMITLMSLFSRDNYAALILASVMGILFSGSWFFLLKSYRQLNSGKFKVVHRMEAKLPYKPYDVEWVELGKGKDKKRYWPLSHLEVVLPFIFMFLYLSFLIFTIRAVDPANYRSLPLSDMIRSFPRFEKPLVSFMVAPLAAWEFIIYCIKNGISIPIGSVPGLPVGGADT